MPVWTKTKEIWSRADILRAIIQLIFITAACAFTTGAFASSNSGITYHGRILKADGTLLEGTAVQFKLQIRSPGNESCLLYEEIQTLNMSTSSGVFSISLNDGSGTRDDGSGVPFTAVFSNRAGFTFASGLCALGTSYTPNAYDGRSFVVSFKDETMQAFEALPVQPVNFAPTAIQALQIAGFGPTNLLRVDDTTAASNTSPLNNTQFSALMAVANGTAPYVSSSTSGGALLPILATAPLTPSPGAFWFNSATNSLQYYNGSITQTLGTSSSTGTVTSVGTGTGLSGGPITGAGTISLATFGTAGTYYKVITDNTGRVSSGSAALVAADIPTLSTAGSVSGSALTSGIIAGSTAINSTGNLMTTGTITGANITATTVSANSLRLFNSGNTFKATLTVPALTADYNLIFPLNAGTSGYVLSTDGSGNLSWIAPAAATLSSGQTGILPIANGGTGTSTGSITGSGALSFSAGGTNQNISLTPSGTGATLLGSNVGIGTSSPASTLQIGSGQILVANGTASAPSYSFTGAATSGFYSPAGTDFRFASNGSDQLRIAGNYLYMQNLDVGSITVVPSSNLGVYGNASVGTGYMATAAPANGMIVQGNVGIGTNSPSVLFHVNGAAKMSTLSVGNTTYLSSGELDAGAGSYTDPATGILFDAKFGGAAHGIAVSGISYFANTVGIGTTSPMASLDLGSKTDALRLPNGTTAQEPATSLAGMIRYNTSTTSVEFYNGSAWSTVSTTGSSTVTPQIYGSTAASGTIRIDGTSNSTKGNVLLATAGGSVGVGTASPAVELDVAGSGRFMGNSSPTSGAGVEVAYTSGAGAIYPYDHSSNAYMPFTLFGNPLMLFGSNGAGMVINYLGNVGIATSSPSTALDVNGGIRAGASTVVTATCNSTNEGIQRYNYTSHLMEYCNGTTWQQLNAIPSGSTASVTASGPPASANVYTASSATASYTPSFGAPSNIINGVWPANGVSTVSNAGCVAIPTMDSTSYVTIDLGSIKTLNNVYISQSNAYWEVSANMQFSTDGTNYTNSATAAPPSNNSQSAIYSTATLSPAVTARFVRIFNGGTYPTQTYSDICQIAFGP